MESMKKAALAPVLLAIACVGPAWAQDPAHRTVIRTLKPLASPRVVDLTTADIETVGKVRSMLGASRNRRNPTEVDAAVVYESPNSGLMLAIPIADELGRLLSEEGDTRTMMFDVISNDHVFTIDATADIATGSMTNLKLRDSKSQTGLEFNYTEGKLYTLEPQQQHSIGRLAAAASGNVVSCVINELGALAKPCEAGIMLVNVGLCIGAVAALPASAGLSAIIALPACASVLGDLEKALACAGYDCGFQSAVDQSKAITPTWITLPPSTVFGGLTFSLGWRLSTAYPFAEPITSTRIIASTNSTPQSQPQFVTSTWTGGSVSLSQSLNYASNLSLPLSSFGTKLYFVIEAVSGGTSYYSPVVSSTVTPPPQPTIVSISPNPVSGSSVAQTITISETNFFNGATVSWQSGSSSGTLASANVTFVNANSIKAYMNFTNTTATWMIKINNPVSAGGISSSWFQFKVQKK